MRASYEEVEWPDEVDDPEIRHGWTDPHNPYGGLKTETTDLWGDAAGAAMDEAETVEFDDVWEAAEFIVDFPGGVWDYSEGESDFDYGTGISTGVTLHVDEGDQAFLFALADLVRNIRSRPQPTKEPRQYKPCQIVAQDVKEGMVLDLQCDVWVGSDYGSGRFDYEYQTVTDVTFETAACVVISGDGWSVGFPALHILIRVQEEEA